MPTFDYSADDEHGQPCTGRITASSWSAAQDALRARGWIVRNVHPASVGSRSTGQHWEVRDTTADANAGSAVPIGQSSMLLSLQALAEELPAQRGRAAVAGVVRRLEQGEPLEDAFHAERQHLPRDLSSLMELALPSGRVDFLVHDYLEHCRRMSDLRRSAWVSLAYPLFLTAFLFLNLAIMFLTIVPTFSQIFMDFGTELPGITVALIWIADTLRYGWPILLVLVIGVPIGTYFVLRAIGGPAAPQAALRSIPVLGQGFRWASLSNFCQMLATLVELGIPLPEALRGAAVVSDDLTLIAGIRRIAVQIEEGVTPRDALRQQGSWLAELGAAFHWADRGDDFVESLRASSEIFGARSRVQTSLVFWVFKPVILFGVSVTVGFLVIALFMPLIKLLNDLS